MKMVKIIESMYFLSNKLTEYVHSIDEYIDVDYYLPGCPPPAAEVACFSSVPQ